MTAFTPWSALAGGSLIGLSAVLLLGLNGRIAGVSGIAAQLATAARGDRLWRWLFLLGLVLGTGLWFAWGPAVPALRRGVPTGLLVGAGLLVGYGTALSGGCTSGHGVCGLARFSLRSAVATGIFLAAGMATVFVMRHLWGAA
jgi:uncharacterized membrane protein YedE/YeeE